jgi:hypothetical protein
MLVSMNRGELTVSERLTRIRGLLTGLPGPLGNGEMFVRVHPGGGDSVPREVFTLLDGVSERLERWGPGGSPDHVAADPAELMSRLREVEQPVAAEVLIWLLSTTMAYGGHGRYDEGKAVDVVDALTGLLGYGTRWWVNGEPSGSRGARSWSPVTRCTFDAVAVGAGGGVTVTVLAVDED